MLARVRSFKLCLFKEVFLIATTCYIICLTAVKSESCGACQKKFVWTTAWPMEENYVTYKLIGPLAEQPQLNLATPSGSSSMNQRSRQSQSHQPNYFLHLSTPKDVEENEKAASRTESSDHFARVGIKTEAELDELPNRMELFNNEDHIAAFVNNGNFAKIPFASAHTTNDGASHKSVFSALKSDVPATQSKEAKIISNTFELVSKPEKGSYISSKANAKSHQLPNSSSSRTITKVEKTPLNMPELINLAKAQKDSLDSSDSYNKALKIPYDPSLDANKPFQWCMPLVHRPVAKKYSPNMRKPKVVDTYQLKNVKVPSSQEDQFFSEPNSMQAPSKSSYDSINETPSNILKIVRMDPDPIFKLPPPDSADAESSLSGVIPKPVGLPTAFRSRNSTLKFPSHPIMKGNRVINPFEDPPKNIDYKEIKSVAKGAANFEKSQDVNISKSSLKSRSLHKVPANIKKEKQIHIGERSSSKKRRAFPNPKDLKGKASLQRSARVQPRVKMPFRFRPRIVNNLSGIKSDNNTNFLTAWFKELSS